MVSSRSCLPELRVTVYGGTTGTVAGPRLDTVHRSSLDTETRNMVVFGRADVVNGTPLEMVRTLTVSLYGTDISRYGYRLLTL